MGAKMTGDEELLGDWEKATQSLADEAQKIVAKGLLNIKKDVRARWSNLAHAPALPRAVTYDTSKTATGAKGEVGPDKLKRQGALGNLLEFGSVNNAPIPALAPAADAEEPRFAQAIEDLGAKLLEGKTSGETTSTSDPDG